ncbi:MAG: RHS repeat domain-containing protein, partial [Elusimicrobiales bacterium]
MNEPGGFKSVPAGLFAGARRFKAWQAAAAAFTVLLALAAPAVADYTRGLIHVVVQAQTRTGIEINANTNDWHAVRFTAPRTAAVSSLNIRFIRANNTNWQVWVSSVDPNNADDPQAGFVLASTVTVSVTGSNYYNVGLGWNAVAGEQYWLVFRDNSATRNDSNYPAYQQITTVERSIVDSELDSDTDPNYMVRYSSFTAAVLNWQTASQRQLISTILYAAEPYDGSSYNTYNTAGVVGDTDWVRQLYKPKSSFWAPRISFYGRDNTNPAGGPLYVDVYKDPLGTPQLIAVATAAVGYIGTAYDWQNMPLFESGVYFDSNFTYGLVFRCPTCGGTDYAVNSHQGGATTSPVPQGTWGGTTNKAQTSNDSGATWADSLARDYIVRFPVDTTPPTQAVLAPVDNGIYNASALSAITGTVSDGIYNVRKSSAVALKIQRLTSGFGAYWTGSVWQLGEAWVYVSTPNALTNFNWTYPTAGWLEHDRQYRVVAKAYDSVTNESLAWSTVTFTADNYQPATPGPEEPNSLTAYPGPGVYFDQLTSVSGTAKDNVYHGAVQVVQYSAKNLSSNLWWGGAAFNQAGETWLTTDSLVYDPPNLKYDWSSGIAIMNSQFQSNVPYAIYSKARDYTAYPSENIEAVFSTSTATCDRAEPVSITTTPVNGSRRNSLTRIEGTAWDQTSGLDLVETRIKRNSDGKYWNSGGLAFNIDYATAAWFTVLSGAVLGGNTTTWAYAIADAAWTNGVSYDINSRARDRVSIPAAHYENAWSTVAFTYDTAAPVPAVTDPASLGYITAPLGAQTTAQGTIDTDASLVEVRLQDLTQGATYWNEAAKAWQNTVVWNTAEIYAAGFWRIKLSSGAWVSGRKYELYVKGTDSSIPTANVGYSATQRFWYDIQKPTSTITGLADGAVLTGLATITGTAWDSSHYDPVGTSLDKTELSLYNAESGQYFTGSGWGAMTPLAVSLDGGALNGAQNRWEHNWTITPSTGWVNNYHYELRNRALDKAGNQENKSLYNPDTPKISFTIDLQAPTAVATSPANAGIYGAGSWKIYGTASDNQGLDWVKLCLKDISGNKYWNGSFWQDNPGYDVWFSSENLQGLTGASTNYYYQGVNWVSATYELSAKAKDDVGREQAAITTTTFTIDIQTPDSRVTLPENNKFYNNTSNAIASIQGTSSDDKSGIPNGGVELWVRALGPAGELQWPTTYWNGTGWQDSASPMWLPATLVGNAGDLNRAWTYPTPNFALLSNAGSGHRFKVQARAKDVANNQQAPTLNNYFEYDVVLPTSAILNPADAAESSKWQYLNGQARDPYPGATLDVVQLQIIDRGALNDGNYNWWTGAAWTTTPDTWLTANWTATSSTPTWSWSYTPPSALTDGRYYRVISRSRDKALNYDVVLATATFKYDSTAPQSKLLDIRDYDNSDATIVDRLEFVHGEAWAGVPITEVAVNIYDEGQNRTWEGAGGWVSGNTGTWNTCSGKEYFVCSGIAIPPIFRDGTQDFRGWIKSRAKTAAKTETVGAGRYVYIKRGGWPYSFVSGPQHGSYLSALPEINIKHTWGTNATPTWARVRVENITDATVVQDWTDAAISVLPDLLTYPNYAIYHSTYTVGFSWTNNKIYRLRTRVAYDSSNRIETPADTEDDGVIVVFDQTSPSSKVTVPAHGVTYNSVPQLSGTAGDNLSGVDGVDISIADINQPTTYYWRWWTTSGTWQTGEYFTAAAMPSTYTWTYSSLPAWESGKVYNIRAKAADKAANSEAAPTIVKYTDGAQINSRTFRYDATGPNSALTYPVNGQNYATIASITGTSGDPYSVPTDCQLQLHRDTNDDMTPDGTWSGAAWGTYDGAVWFPTDSCSVIGTTATFSEAVADSVWDNGKRYFLKARGKDVTQTGSNQGAVSAEAVFRIDKEKPGSQVGVPFAAAYNSLPTLSGTATDNLAGIKEVRVTVFNTSQGQYYNPALDPPWAAGTEDAAPWVLASLVDVWPTSATWRYDIGNSTWTSGARYQVRARAADNVDNTDVILSTAIFQYDTDAPVSTVTYPVNGSYLTSAVLPITITGTSFDQPLVDKSGVDYLRMYFRRSNGDYFTGLGWQSAPYELTIDPPYASWTKAIPDGAYADGEKYDVYTKAGDLATNPEAFNLRSTFVYDLTKPTGTITYPYNNGYISQTGYIAGTAYDTPYGRVDKVYVRVKQTTGAKPGHYWRVSDSSWTVENSPQVWNEIPLQGTLSPDATWWQLPASPWQSGEIYEMNMNLKDKAGHYLLNYSTVTGIKADFTAPSSTVTYPAHNDILQVELPVISGSASDFAPGELDKVRVSYKCVSGGCNGFFWNRSAAAWNSGTEIFYDATLLSGNRWEAAGASTPSWVTSGSGINYQIFAKGVDKAANEVAKPGLPGANSSFIQFTLKTPVPVSTISEPPAGTPYYRPSDLTAISGTLTSANTVQIMLTNVSAEPDTVWAPQKCLTYTAGSCTLWDAAWTPQWVSTQTWLAGCAPETFVVGQSTCGYNGVSALGGGNWSADVTGVWPAGTAKFSVRSRAALSDGSMVEASPHAERFFYIDGNDPATTLSEPNAQYEKSVPVIYGLATDTGEGKLLNVEVAVSTQSGASYWNGSDWITGPPIWLPVTADAAPFDTNSEAWRKDSGLPVFENGKTYEVQVKVTDKANRVKYHPVPYQAFTIDTASPTARLLL